MTVITFMSDFGMSDHYVAAVKAAIFRHNTNLTLVDISHHIKPGDIGHAAYLLKHVFRDFPEGSVHLCAIDKATKQPNKLIGLKLENHYFVGYDCGLFSLISNEQPSQIIELKSVDSTFISKDILAPAAAKLANGHILGDLGNDHANIQQLFSRQLKVTKREIVGHIIRIDGYGNLITNILKPEYETILNLNGGKHPLIRFGRENAPNIHKTYYDVESGDCYVIFNSNGNLQIGINNGNAAELLGLKLDSPVMIDFEA